MARLITFLILCWTLAAPALAAPQRVVSVNLCTDQLAMMLAAPGQLISVSGLARDPRASALARRALDWPVNRAQAEEVWMMAPDLVLAGSYTDPATLALLERLGARVERFAPVTSLEGITAGIRRMGRLLGRGPAAELMITDFETRLKALSSGISSPRPLAASYAANGYTTGTGTLTDAVIGAAGLDNLAARLGIRGGGTLSLEELALADPALIITGDRYPGASRSEEIMQHPALALMRARQVGVRDHDWLCGLPQVLGAIAQLRTAGEQLGAR